MRRSPSQTAPPKSERAPIRGLPAFHASPLGKPCLSTRMLIFIPLTFFPPSIPRFPQVGDDRQDRLSATRTEGLDLSPQATRHLRRRSTTRPFQRPRRFHRAKQEYIVVKGIPVSNPIVRHCMPPQHTHHIDMITLSSISPDSASFGNIFARRLDFRISSCAFTS